jgi:hypothetical protein
MKPADTPAPVLRALQLMAHHLRTPARFYLPTVIQFSGQLPPEDILDAVQIAIERIPAGDPAALRYFCGVCKRKIREATIWQEYSGTVEVFPKNPPPQ